MRKFLSILAAIFLSLPVFAEARNALLIANSNYTNFKKIDTTAGEVWKLKSSLEQLGFTVTMAENCSREKMLDSLSFFERDLKEKGGIGFLFYEGHVAQINGKSYLIPVDADIPDERRVATRAVDVNEAMMSMVAETNIIVLDINRTIPFSASSKNHGLNLHTVRGLASTEIPMNSIIAYSSHLGNVVKDGLFTSVFAEKLIEKNDLLTILREVRLDVSKQTKTEQIPVTYESLMQEVRFAEIKIDDVSDTLETDVSDVIEDENI